MEKNLALVILDTLRKDYGDRYVWPKLKALGFKRVETAIAPSPWTMPSHASMLTGLFPSEHGAHLSREKPTMLEVRVPSGSRKKFFYLRKLRSTFISANVHITPEFGYEINRFVRTFDAFYFMLSEQERKKHKEVLNRYESIFTGRNAFLKAYYVLTREGPIVFAKALTNNLILPIVKHVAEGWPKDKGLKRTIRAVKNLDFKEKDEFLLINLLEVHEPYTTIKILEKTEKWPKKYKEFSIYLASGVRKLIKLLEQKLGKDTAIIVTSDHGQLLGEHTAYGHTFWLHDELLKVPLYVKNLEIEYGDLYSLVDVPKYFLEGSAIPRETAIAEGFAHKDDNKTTTFEHRVAAYTAEFKGVYSIDRKTWLYFEKEGERTEKIPRLEEEKMKKEIKRLLVKSFPKNLISKFSQKKKIFALEKKGGNKEVRKHINNTL